MVSREKWCQVPFFGCQRALLPSSFSFSCRIIWAMSERTCFRHHGLESQRTSRVAQTLSCMFAPSLLPRRVRRIHKNQCMRHPHFLLSAFCFLPTAFYVMCAPCVST